MFKQYDLLNKTIFKAPLSTEEQNKYLELALLGDERAKEIILERNLRLVVYVINRYYKDIDDETKKDLFSVGCLELWKIIQKFKIEYGNEFSTYAIPSIYGSMKCYINKNNSIHISKKIKELSSKITKLQNEYADKHINEQLSTDKLSKILGESEKNIILASSVNQPVISLNSLLYQEDYSTISVEEKLSDQNIVIYENIEKEELYNDLVKTLDKLSEQQKTILILIFGLDGTQRTQKEVSEILNISQAQVSRIKIAAIKKLKMKLPGYIKEEFQANEYVISKSNSK